MRPVRLEITHTAKSSPQGTARAGVLHTPHGPINTPAFVAVGTKANVKGIQVEQFGALGIQTIIVNTYHMYLSGLEVVKKAGGLHNFMGFTGPIMTDSGGFQVFSLGEGFGKSVSKFSKEGDSANTSLRRDERDPNSSDKYLQNPPTLYDQDVASQHGKLAIVDNDGVTFTSHVDGSLHRFTPERSVEIQHDLGGDIFFAFDQCTAPTASYEFQKEAMERTHVWAKRSLAAHRQNIDANNKQAIYGIAQGGQFDDLRLESARTIGHMGFDGFGLGGSFSKKYGDNSLESALNMLSEIPADMPVHGLGVGEPEDLLLAASRGVDTFDCVVPTRNGRTGGIYTKHGKIQIPNAEYQDDFGPLDHGCACPTCTNHTRAYVHHLFRTHEMLGGILASVHNIYFLTHFVAGIRQAIIDDTLEAFQTSFLQQYKVR
jgi:queuine tRNA-ribosyltransferase